MAMMISKFHKLIQSKVVWYVILGIVVITFVGFFTPSMRSGNKQEKPKSVGELFGKKVSYREYRRSYSNAYIWYILSSGRPVPMDEKLDAALRKEAWQRLAAVRKAQQDGILASDDEVILHIQQMPVFCNQNGVYDPAQYKGVLQAIGVSGQQVENLFREQILISKLMYRYMQSALISPDELQRAYHLYTDRFVLDYAILTRAQVDKEVTVSSEDAEAVYTENPEQFRMPEKVSVSYITIPVSNYLDQASVTDEDALQYYNRNMENYRIESTNDVETVEYKPFDEVKEEITTGLRQATARRLAASAASELVAEIAPKAEGEQPDFKGVVESAGLKIKVMPAFGPKDPLPGIDRTAPFRQAAFSLQNDAYSSFSDAVVGQDSVYVLSLIKRYESFVPEFNAVEKEAMKAARSQAVSRKLAERGMEIKDAVQKAVAAGTGFDAAVKPFGLTVEKTKEFDLSTGFDSPYSDALLSTCLNAEQGEVCGPTPVDSGVLIAYVAERKATDMEIGLPAVRDELIDGLTGNMRRQLASDWQAGLLKEAGFKETQPKQ